METIRVFMRPSQLPGSPGNHMWIVYTNASGVERSLSGWSNTSASISQGWGSLDVQVTTWGRNSWDYDASDQAVGSHT